MTVCLNINSHKILDKVPVLRPSFVFDKIVMLKVVVW